MNSTSRLRFAAGEGEVGLVGELLRAKVPVTPDKEGRRALHHASAGGHAQIVKMLLDSHLCSVDELDVFGMTPLHVAASQGHLQTVHLLIMSGANVNKMDSQHGNSPLHESAWKGYAMTVDVLCRAGSDVNSQNKTLSTPLHLAAQNGHNQTSRVLLSVGANPNLKNTFGDTALHTATRYGHAGVARILLSMTHLIRVNIQNKNGDTAAHIASALKRRKIISLLITEGIDISIRNMQGETPVDVALRKGHAEVADLFTRNSQTRQYYPSPSGMPYSMASVNTPLLQQYPMGTNSASTHNSNPTTSYHTLGQLDSGHATGSSTNPDWMGSRAELPILRLVAPPTPNSYSPTSKLPAPGTPAHNINNGTISGPFHDTVSAFNADFPSNDKFTDPKKISTSRENTPNAAEAGNNKDQITSTENDKKKKKFSLFRFFRKKNKDKVARQLVTPSALQPQVPAMVASCHEPPVTWYRDLAGNIHQGQAFTSVCTCHLSSTTNENKARYVAPCIEHGTREWHGSTNRNAAGLTATAPYYLNAFEDKKVADHDDNTLTLPAPRLFRTRSDESLSMSEYKYKTQEQKRKAILARTANPIDYENAVPQFGRRGVFHQPEFVPNSPLLPMTTESNQLVPTRPPRHLSALHRASPDGMSKPVNVNGFRETTDEPQLIPTSPFLDRSQTPDSEVRSRNRQAAERLHKFRELYSRGNYTNHSPVRQPSFQRGDMQTSKV